MGFQGAFPSSIVPMVPRVQNGPFPEGQAMANSTEACEAIDGQLWLLRKMFVSICGPFFGILQAY